MMLKCSTSRGFTLLEGIIAITVISVGLTAALSLALSNLASSTGNEKRIVAANLAREGIELVRNQRDSNWLKMDLNKATDSGTNYSWDTFESPAGPVGAFFVPKLEQNTLKYSWQTVGGSVNTCDGQDCFSACPNACKVYYDDTKKLYSNGQLTGGTLSDFRRILTMQSICYNDANSGPNPNEEVVMGLGTPCSGTFPTKVGVLVTSIVRYDQGKKLDVVVKERLYNWR